jgi:hypothetical protein
VFPFLARIPDKKSGRHEMPTAYGRDPEKSNQ